MNLRRNENKTLERHRKEELNLQRSCFSINQTAITYVKSKKNGNKNELYEAKIELANHGSG